MQLLLFLFLCLLQTALIYWNHFSPFERESNLQAVLWGARPAPRYWAVLALDLLTGLLVALLALLYWPGLAGSALPALAGLALAGILGALAQHFFNAGLVRFPNPGMILPRWLAAALLALLGAAAVLLAAAVGRMPSLHSALALWLYRLPVVLLPIFMLLVVVFLLRGLAFCLRVLPLLGDFLHAVASTGLLVAWLIKAGGMLGSMPVGQGGLPPGSSGELELLALAISILALLALLLAWRLPVPQAKADGIQPPALVVEPPADDRPVTDIHIKNAGATLSSRSLNLEITRQPFGLRLRNASGALLWQLAENGLRRDLLLAKIVSLPVLYTGNTMKMKLHMLSRPVEPVASLRQDGDTLVVLLGAPHPCIELRLAFRSDDVLHLQIAPVIYKSAWRNALNSIFNALTLESQPQPGEHAIGFGQRFGRVDQRGQELYFLVEEGGVGYAGLRPLLKHIFGERGSFPNGEQCTGFPVPFGLLCREQGPGLGLFWDTYCPSWLRIPVDEKGRLTLSVLDRKLDVYLCAGPTPMQCLEQFALLNGRPALPPDWVFLPWKTRTGPVTEADTFEDMQRFRELKIPLSHVGIEHWMEVRGSYEFSPRWYPHVQDLVASAQARGFHITAWHFPYMNAGSAAHLEGVRQGYFIRNRLGLPYQQRIFHGLAAVIDYTNPQASDWHAGIVAERLYRQGFSGSMTDYGESIPPDCVFYNGASGLELRNAYPVLYTQSMQRAAQQVLGADHLIYTRCGYAGAQRYANVQWPGDQDTDWDDGDGLPAAVRAMLNVSMSGFPVHGSDIGGWYDWFTPPTTKELFIRWAEVGAYSPLMRAHGGPKGRNREPWKFDAETVEIYRCLSEEHVRLFPYLYSLAVEASRTGRPIIRHPALLWPECPELYEVEDAWMVGEALYVAPVMRQGQTRREVFLPPGEWWDLNADRPLTGPVKMTVEAPLGRTPRFLRRGHILPRFQRPFDTFDAPPAGPAAASAGSLDDPLEAWLYPADEVAEFILFDGGWLRYSDGQPLPVSRRLEWRLFGENAKPD